ncbi:hypothetical protein IWX83_001660 [Flavobacterium sp. CG_9.1]|uniref:Uncharacterized protein n=1 Tax=Flavobacterium xanthum TaxID=69322 RepID=A0A1M7DZW5_9FLAO|nr:MULTISPECIES: hypothetical protein [Flavobacterium]MBG6061866.1 hypothetical protein [Flavobacterium sp. CG_9.1]SHL85032.1 hypothetical protein SAMN05443669_101550 [Flavobacterium xanthum]
MNETEQPPERIKIAEKELFLKLMIAPRTAFQFINEYKYEKHLYILLFLAGIVRTFDRASTKNMGNNFSLWNTIAVCVIFGGIFGWIS